MPDADGFEFLEVLRKNESWQDIAVIVLTALDLDEHGLAMLNVDVESVLRKASNNQRSSMTQNALVGSFYIYLREYCFGKDTVG